MQHVQGTAKYIKNCHVVTLIGEAIRCYTLSKGDLGATTAKKQLFYVLGVQTLSPVIVLSHTFGTKGTKPVMEVVFYFK